MHVSTVEWPHVSQHYILLLLFVHRILASKDLNRLLQIPYRINTANKYWHILRAKDLKIFINLKHIQFLDLFYAIIKKKTVLF